MTGSILHQYSSRKSPAVVALLLLLVCLLTVTGCSGDGAEPSGDRSLSVSAALDRAGNTEIIVRATLHRDYVAAAQGGHVYLFALTPGTVLAADAEPIAEAKAAQQVKFTLTDVRESALYAGYVLADCDADGAYHMLTKPVYLSNAQVLGEASADAKEGYPDAPSIKGLWISDDDDAVRLSPSHTVITVALEDYLWFSGGSDAVEYLFDGVTHYLRRDAIDALDRRVRLYTDAGMQVYLNIVLDTFPSDAMPHELRALYAGEVQPDAGGYAIRIADYGSFSRIAGFLSFLAERYTRADGAYGFCGAMIIGGAANQNRTSYYGGSRDISVQATEYLTLLRIADTAMRTHFADGRVYAAVASNFSAMTPTPGLAADPLLDYAARDFLDLLAAHSRLGGDFPWHIALTMTSLDSGDTRLWEPKETTLPNDAYITPNSLGVLTDYLEGSLQLADGRSRRLIISDFSIPSGGGSADELADQSASYAYTYAKVLENGSIDALIYRGQTDAVTDMFGCGLRSISGDKRPIHESFSAIDRIDGETTDWTRMGDVWTALSSTVEEGAYLTLTEGTAVKAGSKTDECDRVPLFDFSVGDYQGFRPAENAEYLALVSDTAQGHPVLRVPLERTRSDACMGVRTDLIPAAQFARAEYLSMNCLAETTGTRAYLWLRLTQVHDGKLVYEAEAPIVPNEWTELYFDIADYADALQAGDVVMHIWLQGDENDPVEGEYALRLDTVDLLIGPSHAWIGWLIATPLVVLLLVLAFLGLRRYRRHLEEQRKVHLR